MPRTKSPESGGRKCGAKLHGAREGNCGNPAGAGTDHLGWGFCKFHGGNSPALRKSAANEMGEALKIQYGGPIEIEPAAALLAEVHRSAGHVAWLGDTIQRWEGKAKDVLLQVSIGGFERSAWVRLYQDERAHLAKVAKMAIDAGVAERQVKLAEEQGALIAQLIRSILGDLDLSPEQLEQAPAIVRRHLMSVAV